MAQTQNSQFTSYSNQLCLAIFHERGAAPKNYVRIGFSVVASTLPTYLAVRPHQKLIQNCVYLIKNELKIQRYLTKRAIS